MASRYLFLILIFGILNTLVFEVEAIENQQLLEYTVNEPQTLMSISLEIYGKIECWKDLYELNFELNDVNGVIPIGQRIKYHKIPLVASETAPAKVCGMEIMSFCLGGMVGQQLETCLRNRASRLSKVCAQAVAPCLSDEQKYCGSLSPGSDTTECLTKQLGDLSPNCYFNVRTRNRENAFVAGKK